MIGFKCDAELHEEIFQAANGNISQFLRDAILEKLKLLGIDVDPELFKGRSRKGVGGPKKTYIVSDSPSARIAEANGDNIKIDQSVSQSPSDRPRRVARTAKAGIPPQKKITKKNIKKTDSISPVNIFTQRIGGEAFTSLDEKLGNKSHSLLQKSKSKKTRDKNKS